MRAALKMKHELIRFRCLGFQVQIVNQARLSDEHGEEHVTGAADPDDWLKGLRVNDVGVVNGCKWLGIQFASQTRL